MESVQDIEAEETAKDEEWETVQSRLLTLVAKVRKYIVDRGMYGFLSDAEIAIVKERGAEWNGWKPEPQIVTVYEAKQALDLLESEIQQLSWE